MSSRFVLIAAVFLTASPAFGFDTSKLGQFGSLPLSDIMPLIGKSAQLQSEVKAALSEAKKDADSLMCDGARFPGSWVNLGGERAAPYTCDFGGKWLVIDATVRVTGKKGRAFEKVDDTAMKNADKVTESKPTWTWTIEDPNKEK